MTRLRLGIIGLAVAVGVFAGWRVMHGTGSAHAADPAPPPPAVPVTTATAQVRDVPVYLDGLGTVQAFNVVQIKAQVNGTLIALPAHEGQEVHKGDVVAEIDPTPYKAALDQAIAQRAEDAAQLQSAQLDLKRYQSLAAASVRPGPAGGRPAGDGQQGHRRGRARQRGDRNRAVQFEQLRDSCADRRAGEPLPGRCRQPDRGRQPDRQRHRIDHPGQADFRGVHPAGGRSGAGPGRASQGRRAGRRRPTARTRTRCSPPARW